MITVIFLCITSLTSAVLLAALLVCKFKIIPQRLKGYKEKVALLEEKEHEWQTKVSELEEQLANTRIDEYREFVGRFSELIDNIPDYTGKQSYEEKIHRMSSFMNQYVLSYSTEGNRKAYAQFANGLLAGAEAFTIILKLREMMNQVQQELQRQEDPNSEQCRKNMDMLLNISMVSFDLVTTAFGNHNSREEQKLNRLLLTKEITREEALLQAKVMTSISTETPKWLRAIKDTLALYGIRQSEVIFSGYKLEEKQ